MTERATADVVIVGAGFSGTMAAAQLVRRGKSVVLVEGGGRAGRGTAYSTREAVHLLNVPAAKMSAWPDRPDDFVAQGHAPDSFAPRRDFGAYLGAILDEAEAGGVDLVEGQAVSAQRVDEAWQVRLADGRIVAGRALVLAQGNQPPEPMRVGTGIDPRLFVNNPWGQETRATIERVVADGGDVLILGTGLTMVDMVLSLDAARFGGRIVALSRRGQVPRAHAAHDPAPVDLADVPQGNLRALWRWLRRRSGDVGFRAAVDALRPHAQAVWRGLERDEQRRFLRHARPYWDVHRHRIAPQVSALLQRMIGDGRLEIVAGRVTSVVEDGGGLVVRYARRGASQSSCAGGEPPSSASGERFSAVFNCTGPLGAIERTRDPLLRQLLDDRLVAVDALGIGLAVEGAGRAGERLWALGPLTKGAFWEIVAVPDIRGQAAEIADDVAEELA